MNKEEMVLLKKEFMSSVLFDNKKILIRNFKDIAFDRDELNGVYTIIYKDMKLSFKEPSIFLMYDYLDREDFCQTVEECVYKIKNMSVSELEDLLNSNEGVLTVNADLGELCNCQATYIAVSLCNIRHIKNTQHFGTVQENEIQSLFSTKNQVVQIEGLSDIEFDSSEIKVAAVMSNDNEYFSIKYDTSNDKCCHIVDVYRQLNNNDQMMQHYMMHGNCAENSLKNVCSCVFDDTYKKICDRATEMLDSYNWHNERINAKQLKELVHSTVLCMLSKSVVENEISVNVSTNVLAEFCSKYRYEKNGNLVTFKSFMYNIHN